MQRFARLAGLIYFASSMACATAEELDGFHSDGGRDTTVADSDEEDSGEEDSGGAQDTAVKPDTGADSARADAGRVDAAIDSAATDTKSNDVGTDARIDAAADSGGTDAGTDARTDAGADSAWMDTAGIDAAGFTCPDDSYDVDNNIGNGCEAVDSMSIHTTATAHSFGDVSECDSWETLTNTYASDLRTHTPSMTSGELGRPDYVTAVHKDDALCVNNPNVELRITAGVGTYRLTVYRASGAVDTACSPKTVVGVGTTGEVLCSDQNNGEKITFKIEKVSGPSERASYTLRYHN